MPTALEELAKPAIIGRSSSHFTRATRIFAAEMRVNYSFQVVRDLLSCDPGDYGENPALRLPTLHTPRGAWFGALNICRELSRQSSCRPRTVWPEDLHEPLLANAQELVVQAMTTEVTLIMAGLSGSGEENPHQVKMRKSLVNTMWWLENNARHVLDALPPERDLSYLEVTLFCLVTHLEFRDVLPISSYAGLNKFCQHFAERESTDETIYRFDT
jgi:hypothetical protein